MHKIELKYIIIEYSDKDLSYIDTLCDYVEKSCAEIISFFGINNFGKRINVKLWDSLNDFRDCYRMSKYGQIENAEVPKWLCGFAKDDVIHALSLEELRKTEFHGNSTLQKLEYLVMHEFTHSCHLKLNSATAKYAWLSEGLATTITHQLDNTDKIFELSLNQAINGGAGADYKNYHTMFSYVHETYGRDYILDLIRDNDLLKKDTPNLYEETSRIYGNNRVK